MQTKKIALDGDDIETVHTFSYLVDVVGTSVPFKREKSANLQNYVRQIRS